MSPSLGEVALPHPLAQLLCRPSVEGRFTTELDFATAWTGASRAGFCLRLTLVSSGQLRFGDSGSVRNRQYALLNCWLPSTDLCGSTNKEKPMVVAPTPRTAAMRVVAAILGNALEFYDFTVYAAFAAMIGRAFFPASNLNVSLLLSVATFGVGFVARPLGGILIGAYADRFGRKPAMTLTIWLMRSAAG